MERKGIIVHGYACLDNIICVNQGIKPGDIGTENEIYSTVGGVCGNTGTTLAKLGNNVYLAGRVGSLNTQQYLFHCCLKNSLSQSSRSCMK